MNPVESVDVDGVTISRNNLCGLVWVRGLNWESDVYLRAYIIDGLGDLDYVCLRSSELAVSGDPGRGDHT